MTSAAIIRDAQADGLTLAVSARGKLCYSGEPAVVERWLPVIREHKAELLRLLAANEPTDPGPKLNDLEEPGRSAGWRIYQALLSPRPKAEPRPASVSARSKAIGR